MNEREKDRFGQKYFRKGAINPARLLKLVLFLFQLAKSIEHTRIRLLLKTTAS